MFAKCTWLYLKKEVCTYYIVHVLHFVHFAYVHTNVIVGKNEY